MNEKKITESARGDIIGKRFGMLVAVERLRDSKIRCQCDCGKEKTIFSGHLNTGSYKSCGCKNVRHGHSFPEKTREYTTYHNMMARCHKPSNKRYVDYGGKGITVCDRWRESFVNFIEDMGPCPPGMQIDRIDNRGIYSPENCRWVTPKENMANRSNSGIFVINGLEFRAAQDAANHFGLSTATISAWCRGRRAGSRFYPPRPNCSYRKANP